VASAAREGKDSLRDRAALLGSELLTSNSEFPGHRFGFARALPDPSRSGWAVRRQRGGWINVRDVRKGGVDQAVVLFELLTLLFFVLIH
jgi:hypothetical protein